LEWGCAAAGIPQSTKWALKMGNATACANPVYSYLREASYLRANPGWRDLPVLIRQNDTSRSNPDQAISMRMHDCLRTAVASPAERGLQVKADLMNLVSRRNLLAAAASWA